MFIIFQKKKNLFSALSGDLNVFLILTAANLVVLQYC